jgi:hypothetical protein
MRLRRTDEALRLRIDESQPLSFKISHAAPLTKRKRRIGHFQRRLCSISVNKSGEEVTLLVKHGNRFEFRPQQPDVYRSLISFFQGIKYEASRIGPESATRVQEPRERDTSAFLLCLSLLHDLNNWGAEFEFFESCLYVWLPDIGPTSNDSETKSRIRKAMQQLKTEAVSFQPSLSVDEAIEFITEGQLELDSATELGGDVAQIFRDGVTTWSMPYRTREGRSERFVLSLSVGKRSIPVAILEIGDDAPHNPPRDRAMGLSRKKTDFSKEELSVLAERFYSIRKCLHPAGLPTDFQEPIESIEVDLEELKRRGRGREGTLKEISKNKRITYLYRLLSAELSCRGLVDNDSFFSEGLRVLRDLTIPRVNVELTICGALPPFGQLLIGKLAASMAAHPAVRRFVNREFGLIAKSVFDTTQLKMLFPNHGAIFITTKGLFPGHSSQYNGVVMPGIGMSNVKMKKIGDTEGKTSSHLSDMTMRLAVKTVEERNGNKVSRVYGAGGAKRQRTITEAVRSLGLPVDLSHAQISRPVYGVNLVSNLDRVVLYNEDPEWLTEPFGSLSEDSNRIFQANALGQWRNRWMEKALSRVNYDTE